MKHEHLIHGTVGIGGTTLAAWLSSERAATVAGLSTAAWMLWQLGCSVYDRIQARRRRK